MGRKRVIDTDELYFNTKLVKLLGSRGLHLYIRLWSLAEDWGGYEPNYEDIALRMGALRFTTSEVEKHIQKLIENGKILSFAIEERAIHWLVNFLKNQPLNNPAPPRLPLPEWVHCDIKEYKSGKKYAKYTVITEKLPVISTELPVAYRYRTGNSETKRNETKRNRVETGGKLPVPYSPADLKEQLTDPLLTVTQCFISSGYQFTEKKLAEFKGWFDDLMREYPDRDFVANAKGWRDYNEGRTVRNHKSSFRTWVAKPFAERLSTRRGPKTIEELDREEAQALAAAKATAK